MSTYNKEYSSKYKKLNKDKVRNYNNYYYNLHKESILTYYACNKEEIKLRKYIERLTRYCKDYTQIENYDKAKADNFKGWHCHHRDEIRELPSGMIVLRSAEELKENGRYYNCPPNELIFLTESEHISLHHKRPL